MLILFLSVIFFGCSSSEVIRVGTPFNENGTEGVKFDKEIKDSKSIEALREIIRNVREIEKPEDLNTESETFILLDRPKDSVAENDVLCFV